MPNKHKNRLAKRLANKSSHMLVTESDIANGNPTIFQHDRENIVSKLTPGGRLEAQGLISERLETAKPQTDEMKSLMQKLDMQDDGLFSDDMGDKEERFFLPKSREDLDIIYAFLLDTVTQLRPLVSVWPKLTTLVAADLEWKRCKVAEALIQFYFDDVWRIVDNQFPQWLRHFLMYPSAYYKISYMETNYEPDLKLDVVDRAMLYIDPMVKRIEDAQWVAERYFITKHEVMERVNRGDWNIPSDDISSFEQHMTIGNTTDDELSRFMGTRNRTPETVEADELVEIVDYWQYPRKGLGDVYAVMVGGVDGTLVRYGRNFNPYKYNQYIGSSYRKKDRPDGMSLTEQLRPFQKVINAWVNMRNDDVKANVQRRVAVDRDMVDERTIQEINSGESWVSLNEETSEAYRAAGKDIKDAFFQLPIATSTGELLSSDLPFILGQRQETSHISDVFRGGSPAPGTPLGIVQEQLTRNAGAFKPIIRQVMLPFEKMAEIMLRYFKSDEFYSSERVVSIIGKNRYKEVMPEAWRQIDNSGNVSAMQVSPDMMPNDVRFNAVSGADAFAAKTMLNSIISNLFQGLGQVGPEIQSAISENFNFSALWEHMLNVSGLDIDKLQYTPEEKKKREEQAQQSQQQAMQQQMQMAQAQVDLQKQMEEAKAIAKTIEIAAKEEYRQKSQTAIDEAKIHNQTIADLEIMVKKILNEKIAEMQMATHEQKLEEKTMTKEAELESDDDVSNVSPSGGQNVENKDEKSKM